MKKNGFTLIELLITIAIIGILGVIAGGAIINSLGSAKEDINEVQRQMIITAAKTYVVDNMDTCSEGCTVKIETLIDEGYIDEIDNSTKEQIEIVDVTYNKETKQYTYEAVNKVFKCEEKVVTYTIPTDGNYTIAAAGAEGTTGNNYSYVGDNPPAGGKGASINASFDLTSGDELTIVVGCQGSVTQATTTDGTSGAGGGGSFVFKKTSTQDNPIYQFKKDTNYYEILLVAGGGGGSSDNSYCENHKNNYCENQGARSGSDGIGDSWITQYSNVPYSDYASLDSTSNVLGISQFISYDSKGVKFINSGNCFGGFGGGGCNDDKPSYGGGWSNGASYAATSFSSGSDTSGVTGAQSGDGYVKIYKN